MYDKVLLLILASHESNKQKNSFIWDYKGTPSICNLLNLLSKQIAYTSADKKKISMRQSKKRSFKK